MRRIGPTAGQQEVILHPDRMSIVAELALGDRLTAAQVRERLPEMPLATLYRHLAVLTEAEVLAVHDTRQKRGATERTYALAVNLAFPLHQVTSSGRLMLVVSAAAALLIRLFSRYVQRSPSARGKADPMLRFYLVVATDAEYRRLTQELARLLHGAAEAGARSKRGRRRVFCVAAVPESEWRP